MKILSECDRENKEIVFELNHNKKTSLIKLSDPVNLDRNSKNIDYLSIYSKEYFYFQNYKNYF